MQILPSIDLRDIVKHYLFLDTKGIDAKNLRLFSDSNTGVVFTSNNYIHVDFAENNAFRKLPASFLYGQITEFKDIHLLGESALVIVVFKPDGISKLLGIPAFELRNQTVSLMEVLGKNGLEIEEKLLTESSIQGKLKHLNTFFGTLAARGRTEREPLISAAIDLIVKNKGIVSSSQLTKFMGYTERQVERLFMESIGLSPKGFSNVIKLHCFLAQLKTKTNNTNLTQMAYNAGYADQSHLIREFRKHTGMTPGLYSNKADKLAINFVTLPATGKR